MLGGSPPSLFGSGHSQFQFPNQKHQLIEIITFNPEKQLNASHKNCGDGGQNTQYSDQWIVFIENSAYQKKDDNDWNPEQRKFEYVCRQHQCQNDNQSGQRKFFNSLFFLWKKFKIIHDRNYLAIE